jgi:inorganic pyrophosphatase
MIENLKGLCYKNEFDPESGYNNLDHQPSSPVMYHSDYGYLHGT